MEPFMAPFMWALFLALPCAIAALMTSGFLVGRMGQRLARFGRWALLLRILAFAVLAAVAFVAFLVGGVFGAMRLGI